jgi:hypothetical protein
MKLRIFFWGIILAAVLGIPAVNSQTSIILDSTFGLFEDDVDNFLDPNDYGYVEFDNAFIYLKGSDRNAKGAYGPDDPFSHSDWSSPASERQANNNTAGIQGGVGTRINSLYLGFGFDTNLWNGTETISETGGERTDPGAYSFSGPFREGVVFNGRFGILFGAERIGAFKLTLDFDDVSLNTDKNDADDSMPKEFSYSDGVVGADLGWGKNFDIKGGLLSPEFHIGYDISTFKIEQKGPDGFSYIAYAGSDFRNNPEQIFDKMSHLRVNPGAEYLSPTEAHWFTLSYTLDIGLYPQTIHKEPEGESIDWEGYNVINELIGGYVRSVGLTERLALAFGGYLNLELGNAKVDYTGLSDPIEYVAFSVNPDIGIGATYDFVKKPVQLYSALGLSSTKGNFYTLSYSRDGISKTETYSHTFTPWGLSAGLGFKLSPFQNFALDIGLSQNLGYYVSDKLEYVWAWNILDWSDHPFTAALQAIIKF